MLYFYRIDVYKRIDVNKTSASKECDICHCRYFLNKGFKFQPNVCNRCHDLLMMTVNLSEIAILNMKGSDYCCIASWISINEAINLMQNIDLTKKSGTLWSIKVYYNIWGSWNWKNKLHCHKSLILLKDVDIERDRESISI